MASIPQGSVQPLSATELDSNRIPLIIVTTLFFMWGLITSLNDILIPHLKSVYSLSYVQAMLVQFCFFGAYFIISLPAGFLIKRLGYQSGAVVGLGIAASGCALFYPASTSGYWLFLIAFFILASGITILQVAANPYVTVLGPARTASSRLNLTQAFNSLGTTIGPFFGGMLILTGSVLSVSEIANLSPAALVEFKAKEAAAVQGPYLALAAALICLAVFFAFAKLPKISHNDSDDLDLHTASNQDSVLSNTRLMLGALGIFLYVGAEVSIGSLLINFFGEPQIAALDAATAAKYVGLYWMGAMVGRFIGSAVMQKVRPGLALTFNALCSVVLILIAVFGRGQLAMYAIIAVGLCNSIMFPTIFSMALHNLGKLTGQGSGILCMAIVGGALVPFSQAFIADMVNLQISFLLPAVCYLYIAYFGFKYLNLHGSVEATKEPAHI